MMKGNLNNKLHNFAHLESLVEQAKKSTAILEKEMMNNISLLDKEKQSILLDALTKAKKGQITPDELVNITKGWQ